MDEQVALWRLLFAQRGLSMFQAAHDALLEFGGLQVTREGIPEWKEEPQCPFDLNPELLLREVWKVGPAERVLDHPLYPLGKVDTEGGSSHLYIDEQGEVYLLEEAALMCVAPSLLEALECFVSGRWRAHEAREKTLILKPGSHPPEPSFIGEGTPSPVHEKHFVTRLLEQAGWYPGRRVDEQVEAWRQLFLQQGLPMFQAVHDALLEYGGLQVTRKGVPDWVTEPKYPFNLNPEGVMRYGCVYSGISCNGYSVCPLGSIDHIFPVILIDEQGWIYLWAGRPIFIALTLREALGFFILGRSPVSEIRVKTIPGDPIPPGTQPEESSLIKNDHPVPRREEGFVTRMLKHAGWSPGRRVEKRVEAWRLQFETRGLHMFQAAYDALLEYGGLKVTREAIPPGVGRPYYPFDLDPELLLSEVWRVGSAELVLGYTLYPLGKIEHEEASPHLYIDEQGRIYLLEKAALVFVAPSLREALRGFILGQWPGHPEPGPPPKKYFIRKGNKPPPPEEPFVTRILEQAGWHPGRRVEEQVETWRLLYEPRGLPMFQAAHDALLEYGGLQVTPSDFPEGMREPQYAFDLNPGLLIGYEELLTSINAGNEHRIYPLGELDCPFPLILIDERGLVYLWIDELSLIASSLREALGCFISGRWIDCEYA